MLDARPCSLSLSRVVENFLHDAIYWKPRQRGFEHTVSVDGAGHRALCNDLD